MTPTPGSEEREYISQSNYNNHDVLPSEPARIRRRAQLLKAMALESINGTEVVITMEDTQVCRKIRSRVIATGDENIVLEQGMTIPIRSIHRIDFLS
ncbi:MAG: hypothetical protein RL220_1243 [Bacteroidota bacterium]